MFIIYQVLQVFVLTTNFTRGPQFYQAPERIIQLPNDLLLNSWISSEEILGLSAPKYTSSSFVNLKPN